MEHHAEKIHVQPCGSGWEIDEEKGRPIAFETTYQRAVTVAKLFARQLGAESVVVHGEPGITLECPVLSR